MAGNVGYKRPPKEHQFKKGQVANPKGRPKKDPGRLIEPSALKVIQELLEQYSSVKVKRLFLFMAAKTQHQWLSFNDQS